MLCKISHFELQRCPLRSAVLFNASMNLHLFTGLFRRISLHSSKQIGVVLRPLTLLGRGIKDMILQGSKLFFQQRNSSAPLYLCMGKRFLYFCFTAPQVCFSAAVHLSNGSLMFHA